MTQPKSYTSDVKVYVDGRLYEAGEVFVTDQPKGKTWEPVSKAEKAAIEAADLTHEDPSLEGLGIEALRAVAVTKDVNPEGLSKKDLITAIKAKRSTTA